MPELDADVPEAVREVFEHFEDVHVPENLPKEVRSVYERGLAGRCMMCGGRLGEETIVLVNVVGINQVYCSHKCDQDMNVMGYLTQEYDDLKERVEFRGAGGTEGEGVEPEA